MFNTKDDTAERNQFITKFCQLLLQQFEDGKHCAITVVIRHTHNNANVIVGNDDTPKVIELLNARGIPKSVGKGLIVN